MLKTKFVPGSSLRYRRRPRCQLCHIQFYLFRHVWSQTNRSAKKFGRFIVENEKKLFCTFSMFLKNILASFLFIISVPTVDSRTNNLLLKFADGWIRTSVESDRTANWAITTAPNFYDVNAHCIVGPKRSNVFGFRHLLCCLFLLRPHFYFEKCSTFKKISAKFPKHDKTENDIFRWS